MSLTPLQQLIGIINPDTGVQRGRVISIGVSGIKIAIKSGTKTLPYASGYYIGQYVLLDANDSLLKENTDNSSVKTYIV